MFAISIFRK